MAVGLAVVSITAVSHPASDSCSDRLRLSATRGRKGVSLHRLIATADQFAARQPPTEGLISKFDLLYISQGNRPYQQNLQPTQGKHLGFPLRPSCQPRRAIARL